MTGTGAHPQLDDFALLQQWRNGDQAAAETLTRRHYASVRRFFDLKATHLAEDLTQQTFLASVERLHAIRGPSSFKAYLFGIARHLLMRHIRKSGRHDQAVRFAQAGSTARVTSLSAVAVRLEEHQLLLMAFSQLGTEHQIAVELYYWEGMSVAEIGTVLELNPSTVASRLARGRELLRQYVTEMARPGRARDTLLADLQGWYRSLGPLTTAANAHDRASR